MKSFYRLRTVLFVFIASITYGFAEEAKLDNLLKQQITGGANVLQVLVLMKPVDLQSCSLITPQSEVEKCIRKTTRKNQKSIRDIIDQASDVHAYQYFWIVNAFMLNASTDLILKLTDRDEVERIFPDKMKWSPATYTAESIDPKTLLVDSKYSAALHQMKMEDRHRNNPNSLGQGIRIGIFGTPIENHPFLECKIIAQKKFGEGLEPNKFMGTMAAGVIAGSDSQDMHLSIAPASTISAAFPSIQNGQVSISSIIAGLQWLSNFDQQNKVIVSLVGMHSNDQNMDLSFQQMAANWNRLKIIPIFPAGNEGPQNNSIASPSGISEIVSVGSLDAEGKPAVFSSRGGLIDQKNKPDVWAPGIGVLSTSARNTFAVVNGTAVSAALIGGLAALYKQENPNLTTSEFLADLLD
jgi:subtilisin family serine protease